jgi:hypothetical protein
MIHRLTLEVRHDASSEPTPAQRRFNMDSCQLGDVAGKKPHSAAPNGLEVDDGGDEKPRGRDQIIARLVAKDGIDFGNRGRPRPVPPYDLPPVRAQGLLSKF